MNKRITTFAANVLNWWGELPKRKKTRCLVAGVMVLIVLAALIFGDRGAI